MTRSAQVWSALSLASLLAPAQIALAQPVESGEERGRPRLVTVSVDLDEKGAVVACRVTASSGIKELDDHSCEAVREQGKYEPVLDDDGKPVPATIVHTLTWRAEEDGKQLAQKSNKRDHQQ